MKVGDMIKVTDTISCDGDPYCFCFFCSTKSSRVGIVIEKTNNDINHSGGYWTVMFSAGEWRLYGIEMEVISEGR